MSTVWKYTLAITDEQEVVMAGGAELLHVAEQHGSLALWARIDESRVEVRRLISIRGTGHPIRNQAHIGTVVTAGGSLVWHVFDGGTEQIDRRAGNGHPRSET